MSRRERLRAATNAVHEALHNAPPFLRIAQGHITRAEYAALLRFLFRYHATMEAACAAGAVRLQLPALAAAQRRRIAALGADLEAFGSVPVMPATSPQGEGDFAAGILYTVLGSTLGGKVIHRQLDALLPNDTGRTFFKGADGNGADWRLLCEGLERVELDEGRLEDGATFAFTRFAQMLEEEAALT